MTAVKRRGRRLPWLLLVVSGTGCARESPSPAPGSAAGSAAAEARSACEILTAEAAHAALLDMIARREEPDHDLPKGRLKGIKQDSVEELSPSTVKIGPFTCHLKEKRFSVRLLGKNREVTWDVYGRFEPDGKGRWRAVVTGVDRMWK
jgi:hypothetical protein